MFIFNLIKKISYGSVSHLINAKSHCYLFVLLVGLFLFFFPLNFNLIYVLTKYIGLTMHVFVTAFIEKSTRGTFF